jgi:5-keto 4-deoxyuronate isomerase
MSNIEYSRRFASHPRDVKHYDTTLLREEFLIESIFEDDKVKLVCSEK